MGISLKCGTHSQDNILQMLKKNNNWKLLQNQCTQLLQKLFAIKYFATDKIATGNTWKFIL